MPDSTIIIALGSLVTVFVTAYVTLKSYKGTSRATTITGEVALSDGWEKYASKLEKRIEALEQGVETRQIAHDKAIHLKDIRIDELEKRIDDLEQELATYKQMGIQRVDEVKATLHEDVETNLEHLKE